MIWLLEKLSNLGTNILKDAINALEIFGSILSNLITVIGKFIESIQQ